MIRVEETDTATALPLPGGHPLVEVISPMTGSDVTNTMLQTQCYSPRMNLTVEGKIFFVRSAVGRKSLVIVSESPYHVRTYVKFSRKEIYFLPSGYPFRYETCAYGEEEKTLRRYFASVCPRGAFSMLNNWGDGNRGRNISERFYFAEIDAAADIGLDVVQIDDGWQVGSSDAVRIKDENGNNTFYRNFYDGFWDVDRTKFPNGLETLTAYAKTKGVTLGLWFAPDARNHFGNRDRDAKVIAWAYSLGFRYFKLDMIQIRDRADRDAFLAFLDGLKALGDDIYLQLDVTGTPPRLGYTDGCGYGKLFVENRYAYCADYYPHIMLRTLWQLSKYFPSDRFQFEMPNVTKFADTYDADDILAAPNYTAAYRFAVTAAACPLFWMEAQDFPVAEREAIRPLMTAWKQNRGEMARCDVSPIGEEPSGTALTGFFFDGRENHAASYLLLFREVTDRDCLTLSLPYSHSDILNATEGTAVSQNGSQITVTFPTERAYAFIRLA